MELRLVLLAPAAAFIAAAGGWAGGEAATGLRASGECTGSPPRAVVHLRWTPSGAGRQRVQVTIFGDGFRTGRYERSRRLSRTRRTLTWRRARGEAEHHWRVMTRVGPRRVASETSSFMGPGCVGADPPGARIRSTASAAGGS